MSITKMMCLSTCHIPNQTNLALGTIAFGSGGDLEMMKACVGSALWSELAYTPWSTYGWIIYVSDDSAAVAERAGHPELAKAMRYALDNDCDCLLLDCDAEVVDNLPTFEW